MELKTKTHFDSSKQIVSNFFKENKIGKNEKLICSKRDMIVKIKICGICGSDIINILGKSCMPTKKIGHEISGIVSKVGSDINEFEVGDKVIVHHHCPCENCHYCKHNNQTMCVDFTNRIEPNGFSELIRVPEWIVKNGGVIKINDELSFQEAALIEPLACCIRGWNKIKFSENDSIVIFGFGPIGVMHSLIAKQNKIEKIFCVDINTYRLDFCESNKLGEPLRYSNEKWQDIIFNRTNGRGCDLVIISTSDLTTINHAIKILRKGGTILIFGEPNKNYKMNIDMNLLYSKEISIITTYAASNKEINHAIQLVKNKKIDLGKLITHEFPIEKLNDALNFSINEQNKMKIIIKLN